jgi:hypothetical protein
MTFCNARAFSESFGLVWHSISLYALLMQAVKRPERKIDENLRAATRRELPLSQGITG